MDKHIVIKVTAEQLNFIDKAKFELGLYTRSEYIKLLLNTLMTTPKKSDTSENTNAG